METESSLPHSQVSATCPYPERPPKWRVAANILIKQLQGANSSSP